MDYQNWAIEVGTTLRVKYSDSTFTDQQAVTFVYDGTQFVLK